MSKFKSYCVLSAAALSLAAVAAPAKANVLLYSFEATDAGGSTDGFARNGGGITVTPTSAGATAGVGALGLVATRTFVGALSTSQPQLTTLDDPTITAIKIDVFNPTAYAGNFADLGVTLFVGNGATGDFGEQFGPPTSSFANVDFPAGTETSVTIPLTGNSPVTGNPETYAQLLSEGYVPTGFEFAISSDASAATPLSINVDNVQGVTPAAVPEPASLGLLAVGGLATLARRRRA